MPRLSYTFTYQHAHLMTGESITFSGDIDMDEADLKTLNQTAQQLQSAFSSKALTAMDIGNNFFIFDTQDGNRYIAINKIKLFSKLEKLKEYISQIKNLISSTRATRAFQVNTFRPIRESEPYRKSNSTPSLKT